MKQPSSMFIPPVMIDREKKRPIYGQIYDWFRAAITEGRVKPGQRLPSTRSMAAELEISRISVFNAYEQLQSEGYLETFVGSGTCVARAIPEDAFIPSVAGIERSRPSTLGTPRRVSARASTLLKMASEPWLHNLGAF